MTDGRDLEKFKANKAVFRKLQILPGLWIDVAFSQIQLIIVYMFGPIVPILWYVYLKPWFHVPIVVYDSRPLYIPLVDTGIVSKPQRMPKTVQGICAFPECYKTRR